MNRLKPVRVAKAAMIHRVRRPSDALVHGLGAQAEQVARVAEVLGVPGEQHGARLHHAVHAFEHAALRSRSPVPGARSPVPARSGVC